MKGIYVQKRTNVKRTKKAQKTKVHYTPQRPEQYKTLSNREQKRIEEKNEELRNEITPNIKDDIQKNQNEKIIEENRDYVQIEEASIQKKKESELNKELYNKKIQNSRISGGVITGLGALSFIIAIVLLASPSLIFIGLIVFFSAILVIISGLIVLGRANYLKKQVRNYSKKKEVAAIQDNNRKKLTIIFGSISLGLSFLFTGLFLIDLFIIADALISFPLTFFLGMMIAAAALVMAFLSIAFSVKPELKKVPVIWKIFAVLAALIIIGLLTMAFIFITMW